MKKLIFLLLTCISLNTLAQKRTIIMPDGHAASVYKVIRDKQGKYLYSAEGQKCIMWDIKTGHQLYTFRQPVTAEFAGMDISPDGTTIVLANERNISLFSTINGKLLVNSQKGFYSDVIFSEDGKYLYASQDGIHLLDAVTLEESKVIASDISYHVKLWLLPSSRLLVADDFSCHVYDMISQAQISASSYEGGGRYSHFTFLPAQQLIVRYGNMPVNFFDIYTGKMQGSIYGASADDRAVIPSENTHEIIVPFTQGDDGEDRIELYSTDTYKMLKRLNIKDLKFLINGGYFNGLLQKGWLVAFNTIVKWDLTLDKNDQILQGLTADLGADVFNALEYNYETGRLHITTDDQNLKTIDLYRMVPIQHTDLGDRPTALSISPSGDTLAIFDYRSVLIKNIKTNKIIRPSVPVNKTGFLNRNCFFFSNDSKQAFYLDENDNNVSLRKINLATGIKSTVFSCGGLGPVNVHPDKTIMAGFESAYQLNIASVWDFKSGKKIFSKPVEAYGNSDQQFAALSFNKKKVLFASLNKLSIYDIASGRAIVKDKEINYLQNDGSNAANSDLSKFLVGDGVGTITAYDGNGNEVYKTVDHKSPLRRIFFSPDDKLFYTISGDNTIKVWKAATGKFQGILYLFKNSNDYVFMDDEGRFDGSQEGIKKIYSVMNRGEVALDKLFEKYYTPNLYARLVNGEKFDPLPSDIIKPSPKVKLYYAEARRNLEVDDDVPIYQNTTGFADITANASAEDDAVDEIRLFINGKIQTLTTRNLIVVDNASGTETKKYQVSLSPGQNTIRAIALNTQRTESDPDEIAILYNAAGNDLPVTPEPVNKADKTVLSPIDKKATLHLIVVGINQYQNKSMSLNYALADATAFKEELEKDAKSVLGNIKTYFVTDDKADRTSITAALKEVQQNAKPKDVFIFYYAGHGVIGRDKEFYLVPTDVSDLKNVQAELEQKGIAAKLLQQYAIDIQAQKQLFILDACQSAGAFETMMTADANQQKSIAVVARSTGTHWMAASGAQQFANEFSSLGHGAFTYVLLEALKGAAVSNKMITVNSLKNYLQKTVPELMRKYHGSPQYPSSYGFGNDFPVKLQ